MKDVVADKLLIGACGLYCGACRSYLKGTCPGCSENEKASWCKVRSCCIEHSFNSCADCDLMELKDCKKFNTFISKVFGILFNSDRVACIQKIKDMGHELYAEEMAEKKMQTIRKRGRTKK